MQLKNQIRFIHHNPEYGTKFTIAYHRDETSVVFAWTELYYTDEYVKSVGRQVSTERLMSYLPKISEQLDSHHDSVIECGHQCGILRVRGFKEAVSNVISDNLLKTMTLMDFKHAAISNALRNEVVQQINERQY